MLPILACGTGIYVGLHFSILALLPLSLLGAGAYIVTSWATGQSVLDSTVIVVVPIITLQVGYFVGLTTRPVLANLKTRLNIGLSKRI